MNIVAGDSPATPPSDEETQPASEDVAAGLSPDANWRLVAADGNDKVAKALESVTDVRALAASYAALRAAVSTGKFANKIVVPEADAPPEDWARFRAQLPDYMRAPETAGDYKLRHPEWMAGPDEELDQQKQETLDGFVETMHGLGATEAQVQTALDQFYDLAARGKATQTLADARYLQESETALRNKWGPDYDRNKALAERAIGALFGAESDVANLELKNGSLLGSLPSFARGMAQVGRLMGEDPLIGMSGAGGEDLQNQIDTITAQGMRDGNYYTEAVQQKLQPLYAQLHGVTPSENQGSRG